MAETTIFLAFFAGLASFLSPCILPLIPAFLAYLSGISGLGSQGTAITKSVKIKIFLNTLMYVLGFSVVFSLIGILLTGLLSHLAYDISLWLGRIGGLIIIWFGLYIVGLLRLDFLEQEHKFKLRLRPGYLSSFVFGASFAVGWTPCVGAVLAGILALAITQPSSAFWLLLAYSVGLGVPFLLVGLFTSQAASLIHRMGRSLQIIKIISGILLIILGILVFTGDLSRIASTYFLERALGVG